MLIIFEWDEDKSLINQKKHRVSFTEAQSVFADENALFMVDLDHSDEEQRFVLLGMSAKLKILVVCHCYRKNDKVIRIISARKATPKEHKKYLERGQL